MGLYVVCSPLPCGPQGAVTSRCQRAAPVGSGSASVRGTEAATGGAGTATWSEEDLRAVSALTVTAMVATAEAIMSVPDAPEADKLVAEKRIAETARVQLRMLLVGALNWRSRS